MRGNSLRVSQYRTPGTGLQLQWYANASTGNDAYDCQSASAPCLTPQGALNKMPKHLRDGATLSLAAGNYPGFQISGFQNDGMQQTTGGFAIQGTLANSTGLASGTATGTATAVSTGTVNPLAFGTLTDATQNWTVNDLRGRFATIAGEPGAGQIRVIVSNTTTAITIAGSWASTAPTAGSTYAIQDSVTNITGCITQPPVPNQAPSATSTTAVRVSSNGAGTALNIRFLNVTAACLFGFYQVDTAALIVHHTQLSSATGSAGLIAAAGPLRVENVASFIADGMFGTHVNGGGIVAASPSTATASAGVGNVIGGSYAPAVIQNSLFRNGTQGLNLGQFRVSVVSGVDIQNVSATGVAFAGGNVFQGNRISCNGAASSNAVLVSAAGAPSTGFAGPDHITVDNCDVGLKATGPSSQVWQSNGIVATNLNTGILVERGALVSFDPGDGWWDATIDINIDNGHIVADQADVTSGHCITSPEWGSRVCRD